MGLVRPSYFSCLSGAEVPEETPTEEESLEPAADKKKKFRKSILKNVGTTSLLKTYLLGNNVRGFSNKAYRAWVWSRIWTPDVDLE